MLKKYNLKLFCLSLVLLLNSCISYCWIEPKFKREAERIYKSFGVRRVYLSEKEAKELFGGCYSSFSFDRIFVLDTLGKKSYVLEKNGQPLTYAYK
jgi:hypothetical protein